jgi:hypothetical protein
MAMVVCLVAVAQKVGEVQLLVTCQQVVVEQ